MKTAIKIGMMGLSIVLLAGCKEKSHQTEMPAPSISVAMPVVRDITLTKDYPGYLSSDRMVNLVARVNGYLQSSQLVPGAKVKKGDLIFVIEPEVYQNNVTQAEAALNTAKAQVEYARSNYERMKEAAKSGAVSQIQVLQAESTAAEMEASVHNAEAALKTARTNLGYCYIRAPYDGRVTRASYDVGNYINGAVQPVTLATLYKDDIMYANFNIEDNQFMRMKMIADHKFDLIVNIPKNHSKRELTTRTIRTSRCLPMFPYASDRTDGKVIPGHSTTSLPTSTCRPVR